MKLIKNSLILIWRIWFYGLVIFTILPIAPILLIITAKETRYPYFYRMAHYWGKTILFLMGFTTEIEFTEKLTPNKSYMFSGNHTSMIDIMLMFALFKENPFVFVGKIELTKFPIFGYFYKKTMIIVDRNNAQSRKEVFEKANKRIESGLSVCVFPEGMVPSDESIVLSDFKSGAFRLAIEHQIPIVPISIYDNKKRFSYTFFSGGPGKLRVKIHLPIVTKGMTIEKNKEILKKEVFAILHEDLKNN